MNLRAYLQVIELSWVANVVSVIASCDFRLDEQLQRLLKYPHTFTEEYDLPLKRAKAAEIMQKKMSFDFLNKMSP